LRLYRNKGPAGASKTPLTLSAWRYIGPFDNPGGKGFETAYPPPPGARMNPLNRDDAEQIQRRSDLKGPLWLRLTRSQEHLAFSTLAGRAYIDEKLVRIAENESQLAGAIAHEVAHLAARHGAENISRMRLLDANPSGFLTLLRPCLTIGNPFTSGGTDGFWQAVCYFNEIEADELATQYLWNSGFDPEGLLNLLSVLQDHNWLDAPPGPSQTSSHPPISVRQKRIRIQLKKLPGLEAARLDSSDFQEAREQTRANGVPLSRK